MFELNPFVVESELDEGYRATAGTFATGFKTPIYQTPVNISIVTDELLGDVQIENLGEATSYMSGVTAYLQGQQGPEFIVRGFQTAWANKNGVRRYSVNGSDNIERFEVLKGPMAVFYGRVAPGGLVNIVTKRPSFDKINGVELTYGSYDYKRIELESQGPILKDKLAYRFNASFLDKDDWRDFEWQERWFAYGGLLWRPVDKLSITLEYEKVHDERNNAAGIPWGSRAWMEDWREPPEDLLDFALTNPESVGPVPNFPYRPIALAPDRETAISRLQSRWRSRTGRDANALWRYTVEAVRGQLPPPRSDHLVDATPYGWKFNVGGEDNYQENIIESGGMEIVANPLSNLTIQVTAIFENRYNDNLRNVFSDSPLVTGNFQIAPDDYVLDNETWDIASKILWSFHTFGINHNLVFNVSRFYDEWRPRSRGRDGSYSNPYGVAGWDPFTDPYFKIGPFLNDEIGPKDRGEDNRRDAIGFSHTMQLFDDSVTFLWGVRKEKMVRHLISDNKRNGTVNKWEATTPMIGITWEFIKGMTVFASQSQSYNLNSAQSLITPVELATEEELNRVVPNQEGEGFDIGFKTAWNDYEWVGSLSYFQVENSNDRIVEDEEATAADPRLDEDPAFRIRRFSGLSRSRGFELDLTWTPNSNYQAIFALTNVFEAVIVDDPVVPENNGNRFVNSPEWEVAFWNKYTFTESKLENLSIGMGMRYRDPFTGRYQGFIIPSSLVFDALVEYRTRYRNADISYRFNVKNLFDERYIIGDPNTIGDNRQYRFTVDIDF